MAESIFDQPRFQDPTAAREYLESVRWPNGTICPHCGVVGKHYALNGKAQRDGLYKCADCREQFTVTVGTVFERSKIPLHKWVMLTELMCASKKGISSKQIERMLDVTYKTAWFMTHRIREAMKQDGGGMLGSGGIVEADETYIGRKPGTKVRRGHGHKNAVFSLVEREGNVRSFHVPDDHLHRYTTEFDFRYNHREKLGFDDAARTESLLKGISGKRLTYRRIDQQTIIEERRWSF
jgi:transposase-like protein